MQLKCKDNLGENFNKIMFTTSVLAIYIIYCYLQLLLLFTIIVAIYNYLKCS